MGVRAARVLIAMAIAALLVPGGLLGTGIAMADGDPASDVLLSQSAFYPYMPQVSSALQRQLNAETAAAAKAGFPIKVALIASPIDLGAIPQLFGKPQEYADFLDREISFQAAQKLLVVMAAGYGVQGLDHAATSVATGLRKPAGRSSDELAQAALAAIPKLASASGHPIGSASQSATSGSSSSTSLVLVLLIVAAVSTATTLLVIRRRQVVKLRREQQAARAPSTGSSARRPSDRARRP
jgi:hypothetical protein